MERRSEAGTIETGAAASRIQPQFRDVVEAASAATATVSPDASVYVYGSVATGQAEVGRSDVDLLTIGLHSDRARDISSELSERFVDLCRGVEIGAAMPGDLLGEGDEAYGLRVFLRHYCVHRSGSDRHRPMHDFPADARAARGFNGDIDHHRDRWRAELVSGTAPDVLATRLGRKSLLALAGLVSVHDETWTTDRTTAATRWAEIEPDLSNRLFTLLDWTQTPPDVGVADVADMLDDTVGTIVDRFADEIGLWAEP